jgi:pimeloyl-ACP methyl ester carboxylesterase
MRGCHHLGVEASDEGVLTVRDGRRVGFLARGPAAGAPVVYLHGMPGSRREQCLFPDESLNRFGIRLVSFDRPGWGETDPLRGSRPERCRDLLDACDALGLDSFAVLAVSAGGTYALTLAAIAPDRVEAVVLAAAQMPYDDEASIQTLVPDQLALVPFLRLGPTKEVIEGAKTYRRHVLRDPVAALEPSLATFSERERALIAEPSFREILSDEMAEGLRLRVDGLLDDLLLWPLPFEVDVTTIACPVRAFHGTADDREPLTNLRRILGRLRGAEMLTAEGMNHLAPQLYPDLVMSLTRA